MIKIAKKKKSRTPTSGLQSQWDITVATYNIHRGVGVDGRCDIKRIAQVIQQLNAQAIGLQEVDSRFGEKDTMQMDYLAELTGLRAIAGPTIHREDGQYGNALLTSCPVTTLKCIHFHTTGREPRGALDVMLEVKGKPLRMVVTHLGLGAVERHYQAKQLLEQVGDHEHPALVVMGDTNEWFPQSRLLRSIHRKLGKTPAVRTFPTRFPLFSLDRIWIRPVTALSTIQAHKSPLARVASDHLPVTASFRISTADFI